MDDKLALIEHLVFARPETLHLKTPILVEEKGICLQIMTAQCSKCLRRHAAGAVVAQSRDYQWPGEVKDLTVGKMMVWVLTCHRS